MTVFEKFNQLPIAKPNRSGWPTTLIAVMGIVPEEKSLRHALPVQKRPDIDAVDRPMLHAGRRQERRKKSTLQTGVSITVPGLVRPGQRISQWLPDATFEQVSFAGP